MAATRILIVDDEKWMAEVCADILGRLEHAEILVETDSSRALERIQHESLDLLIADIMMPGLDGVELLRRARKEDPNLAALMITAFPKVETAVETMKLGAADYLAKPFKPEDLRASVHRLLREKGLRDEVRLLERHAERGYAFDDIIGASPPMQKVFSTIEQIADADVDVMIEGETGTGKELVARSIHYRSCRSGSRFVAVDCGAIPPDLMESQFFGHERGAFTGASSRSPGLLEYAHGGTFFLDEVGELPLAMQAKLLRVLQERRVRRLGANSETPVDVRILAATSRNLDEEVAQKRFRQDLYYRINVLHIKLPPLRERRSDIPLLVDKLSTRYAGELGRHHLEVDDDVLETLCGYDWPGNIRELQNFLKRAIALSTTSRLTAADLPDGIVLQSNASDGRFARDDRPVESFFHLREERLAAFERQYLDELLHSCDGEVTRAVELAGVPRSTFYRLLQKHDLAPEAYRPSGRPACPVSGT